MIVGVPREVKPGERRVAVVPETVRAIVEEGHDVQVETRAGLTVGFDDEAYRDAGATVVTARDAWDAELVVKVKEMQDEDFAFAQRGTAVFAFHHLVGAPQRTRAMAGRGLTAIAFEMVRDAAGRSPLLAPMSRIAGRMAPAIAEAELGARPRACWCWARARPGTRPRAPRASSARRSPCCGARPRRR